MLAALAAGDGEEDGDGFGAELLPVGVGAVDQEGPDFLAKLRLVVAVPIHLDDEAALFGRLRSFDGQLDPGVKTQPMRRPIRQFDRAVGQDAFVPKLQEIDKAGLTSEPFQGDA